MSGSASALCVLHVYAAEYHGKLKGALRSNSMLQACILKHCLAFNIVLKDSYVYW